MGEQAIQTLGAAAAAATALSLRKVPPPLPLFVTPMPQPLAQGLSIPILNHMPLFS